MYGDVSNPISEDELQANCRWALWRYKDDHDKAASLWNWPTRVQGRDLGEISRVAGRVFPRVYSGTHNE